MIPQVGDIFIVTYKDFYNPCRYPNKKFKIKSFSKSGLSAYYEDNRTNIKCKCGNCRKVDNLKSVGISEIKIIMSRTQYERHLSLKKLIG